MDPVRIKSTPETDRRGLSGKLGYIYGFTTPSVTNPTVIGELLEDYAENVYIEDSGQQLWFATQLIEYLDHDPRLEATIGGRRLYYRSDGRWEEIGDSPGDAGQKSL